MQSFYNGCLVFTAIIMLRVATLKGEVHIDIRTSVVVPPGVDCALAVAAEPERSRRPGERRAKYAT